MAGWGNGGAGGGLSGNDGHRGCGTLLNAKGGTQTSGGLGEGKSPSCGGFGYGGYANGGYGRGGGGGGGWYGGGAGCDAHGGAGGSGYIGGVPAFTFNGVAYNPSTANGRCGGNGYAIITYITPLLSVELPAFSSYTERDSYSISASMTNILDYTCLITNDSGELVELYTKGSGLVTENIPTGFEDISFIEHLDNGSGNITISGTVAPEFDGKKIRIVVTGEENKTVYSEALLQNTQVEQTGRTVVGQVGESAEFSFTVHGAKSAALQVRAYGSDIWETYMPATGVVNNPITTTARDGEVTFHFSSLTEDDLKKYYRVVLTNDGSGLVSDEILLTSCIYDLYYDGSATETIYYDGEEVNAVYWYTGTDYVLVYGFE